MNTGSDLAFGGWGVGGGGGWGGRKGGRKGEREKISFSLFK